MDIFFPGGNNQTRVWAETIPANIYSVYGLLNKPGTWRLFNYISTDFYRKVDTMSRNKLTMKVIGWGVKAKVVFELLTTNGDAEN